MVAETDFGRRLQEAELPSGRLLRSVELASLPVAAADFSSDAVGGRGVFGVPDGWQSDDTVPSTTFDGQRTAVVRCSVATGACAYAARPYTDRIPQPVRSTG